jgi:hypothetical protein
MIADCRACRHRLHGRHILERVCVRLYICSELAMKPIPRLGKNRLYIVLLILVLPILAALVVIWVLFFALILLCKVLMSLVLRWRKCPTCGTRNWTYPYLDPAGLEV